QHHFDGPSQYITVKQGHTYTVSGWVKFLNNGGGSQYVQMEVDFHFSDDTHNYVTAAERLNSGPDASVNFVVDDASVTEVSGGTSHSSSGSLDQIIDRERKSDINIHVTTSLNKADIKIRVVQTKKSFPFGTAVNSWKYNDNSVPDGYRDFIHKHFNWAVPESALKWMIIEPQRGHKDYQLALKMIHGVKSHGLKVRGHNLVWSVPSTVQDWVKAECHNTQQLRNEAYLAQALQFKAANVWLYGLGVQCHFGNEEEPDQDAIK
ncbi:hypothetical protein BaRGS_00001695, partial [Batillaria attramentaria]